MRKIKRAHITTIALCKNPKNGLRTLLKADGSVELHALAKAGEGNELLAVVYAPDRPDSDGDFADASVIKAMAHEYNRDHRNLDIEHDGHILSKDEAYLAESFIVSKGDERFHGWKGHDGETVADLTGAWGVVIKLESQALQKALKNGELDGVSMFGKAALEQLDTKAASKRAAERISAANQPKESAMDKEMMKEFFAGLTETLTKALAPKAPEKKEAVPTIEAPIFKGDPTKDKDLEAFEKELTSYELRKGMAEGTLTAAKITEMRKALAETAPSDTEAGIKTGDTPEVKQLKRELHKAQKRSNVPEGGSKGAKDDDDPEEIAKANAEAAKGISKILAGRRGLEMVSK